MNKKAVIILSGGLDSTTLLWKLVKERYHSTEIQSIIFDYGQKHNKEISLAIYNCVLLNVDYKIINLSEFTKDFESALTKNNILVPKIQTVLGDPQPVSYVPMRNQLFLTIACGIAESIKASEVYYGAQKHDLYSYWDTTVEFIERFNNLISLNRKNQIKVYAPFANYSKGDTIREGLKLKVDYSKTWSCYNGQDKACGDCPTCAERLKGFADNNTKDPIEYEVQI